LKFISQIFEIFDDFNWRKLSTFLIGYFIFGVGFSGLTVPAYSELNKIATWVNNKNIFLKCDLIERLISNSKSGYPNDLRTHGLISGLFSGVHSFA
jgi:hypothetical protein